MVECNLGIMSHDIAFTLQSLKIIHKPTVHGEPIIVVDWSAVDTYIKKATSNTRQIRIDPECLRWTPLISPVVVRQSKEVSICLSEINFLNEN